jgi:haloacetate dehalogenase
MNVQQHHQVGAVDVHVDSFLAGISHVPDCVLLDARRQIQNPRMYDGFSMDDYAAPGGRLRYRQGGSGPALLLLHGHPQSHVMWHRVAPALARRFRLVLADLPGYGDSARRAADAEHRAHSKRQMANDLMALMQHLGHARFDVLAHDRGARVAHRMALDQPAAVRRLMLLDIAPTLAMYEHTGCEFARAYWHWFFLIQPAPLPERLIEADPAAYLHDVMTRRHAGMAAFAPEAWAEYQRCIRIPGTASSICEDYRASAGIDLEHDRADRAAGRLLSQPLRVLWGAQGAVGRCFDVPALWQQVATQFSGQPLPCGHYVAEEAPELLLAQTDLFFKE